MLILLAAIGVGVSWKFIKRGARPDRGGGAPATLAGKVGGEKVGFLDDPEVQRLLAKANLTLDAKKEGSVEMVREPATGQSFLRPTSSVSEKFRLDKDSAGWHSPADEITPDEMPVWVSCLSLVSCVQSCRFNE